MVITVLWVGAMGAAVPVRAQENGDCFACHSDKAATGKRDGRTISVYVDEKKFSGSVHASLSCIACHADLAGKELPHDEHVFPVDCGACHTSEQELHAKSLHGKAMAKGDPLAPHCRDCHGNHEILPAKDPRSPISALKVPFLCGKCHREGAPVANRGTIHQDHILENFSESSKSITTTPARWRGC